MTDPAAQLATLAVAIEQHPSLGSILVFVAESYRHEALHGGMQTGPAAVPCDPAPDSQRPETEQVSGAHYDDDLADLKAAIGSIDHDDRQTRIECLRLAMSMIGSDLDRFGDALWLARRFARFAIEGTTPNLSPVDAK